MPLFITNAIKNKPLPLYGDGKNIRDWIFVLDNCSAILLILRKGISGEIYNIGGPSLLKNIDIAKELLAILGKGKDLISFVNDRPGHDRRYALDSTKLKSLGWRPRYNFRKALDLTVDWYLKNRQWWQPLKDKAEIIKW
jgi:dTDP-glucose 4,6-dehydratase